MREVEEPLHPRAGGTPLDMAPGSELSQLGWGGDLELVNSDSTKQRNKFFAREIEVSAEEFEECRSLYFDAVWQQGTTEQLARRQLAEILPSPPSLTPQNSARSACRKFSASTDEGLTPELRDRRTSRSQSILLSMPKQSRGSRCQSRSCLGLPIVSPMAYWYHAWRWIILALDASYAAFIVPIHTAMEFQNDYVPSELSWMNIMEMVVTSLYSVDILVQFNVAWIAVSEDLKQILVLDGRKNAKFYFRKGFIFDFVTTVPVLLELIINVVARSAGDVPAWLLAISPWLRALRLLRFVRVFRICRLDFLTRVTSRMDLISPSVSSLVMLIYFISFGVNLLGCMWYMIAWFGGYNDSWLATKSILIHLEQPGSLEDELAEIPLTEASFSTQFIASLYWATTTVTTVGYGDITPANAFEMGVAIFVEFLGVLVFGLLIGILSSIFLQNSRQSIRAQALQDRVQEANEWMMARHLPKDLRTTVCTFYTDVWQRQVMAHDDAKMLKDLPFSLRSKVVLSIVERSLLSAPQDIFCCMPQRVQHLLAASMVPVTVCSGQDLIEEGSPAHHVWLLHSGEIVELHKLRVAALQAAPQYLGLLNLCELVIDGEEAIGRSSICGFRSVGMSHAWQIKLSDYARVMDAFPTVRAPIVRANIRYLESCIMNPSPVEQWDETAARLLVQLQAIATTEDAASGGQSAKGASMDADDAGVTLELSRSNLERLRKRTAEIEETNKFRAVVHAGMSRQQSESGSAVYRAKAGKVSPRWQVLSMYVRSGEYRKRLVLEQRRRASVDVRSMGTPSRRSTRSRRASMDILAICEEMDPTGMTPRMDPLATSRASMDPWSARPSMDPARMRPSMDPLGVRQTSMDPFATSRSSMDPWSARPSIHPARMGASVDPLGVRQITMDPLATRASMDPRSARPSMHPARMDASVDPLGARPTMGPLATRASMDPQSAGPSMHPARMGSSMDPPSTITGTEPTTPAGSNFAPTGRTPQAGADSGLDRELSSSFRRRLSLIEDDFVLAAPAASRPRTSHVRFSIEGDGD